MYVAALTFVLNSINILPHYSIQHKSDSDDDVTVLEIDTSETVMVT